MPHLIEGFLAELEKRKADVRAFSSHDAFTPEEEKIKEWCRSNWHTLPPPNRMERREFAVDSSRATRTFSNGMKMAVVHSVMVHEGSPYTKSFLDFFREDEENYPMRMSELLEAEIILDHMGELADAVVFVDGSFYSRLQYYLIPLGMEDKRDMPLSVLDAYVNLLEACEKNRILLLNVSKSSNVRFLTSMIQGGKATILDAEALYRWTWEEGYSTPLLVSGSTFMHKDFTALCTNPSSVLHGFKEKDTHVSTLQRIPELSPFVMIHVRLNRGEPPLRIDIPSFCLGINEKLGRLSHDEWCPANIVHDIVSHIRSGYGGRNVYNALLWTADKFVRLERRTVDDIYVHLVREVGDGWIGFDRGYGRFSL